MSIASRAVGDDAIARRAIHPPVAVDPNAIPVHIRRAAVAGAWTVSATDGKESNGCSDCEPTLDR
jgi:hypothetical protein